MKDTSLAWSIVVFVVSGLVVFAITSAAHNSLNPQNECNSNYSGCVGETDYNCPQVGESVRVVGYDVYNLDGDGDGIGCDRYGSSQGSAIFWSIAIGATLSIITFFELSKSFVQKKKKLDKLKRDNRIFAEKKVAISQGLNCPRCNGYLKEKRGKYGGFYGCSNYPKCNFTKKA